MKMTLEDYNTILTAFKENGDEIRDYYKEIKGTGNYKDLEVKVSWDCYRRFVGIQFAREQYDKGLNDTHLTTAFKKALQEVVKG